MSERALSNDAGSVNVGCLPPKHVDRLFIRLGNNYGHAFASQFPTDDLLKAAKAEWSVALSCFDDNEIVFALDEMRLHYRKFAPKLPEFMALCRMRRNIGVPADCLMLEKPPVASGDVGNNALDKIRSFL